MSGAGRGASCPRCRSSPTTSSRAASSIATVEHLRGLSALALRRSLLMPSIRDRHSGVLVGHQTRQSRPAGPRVPVCRRRSSSRKTVDRCRVPRLRGWCRASGGHVVNRVWPPTDQAHRGTHADARGQPDRLAERIEEARTEAEPERALLVMTRLQLEVEPPRNTDGPVTQESRSEGQVGVVGRRRRSAAARPRPRRGRRGARRRRRGATARRKCRWHCGVGRSTVAVTQSF